MCVSLVKAVHHPIDYVLFFFNDTATTEIYTLSLHDALPIWSHEKSFWDQWEECLFRRGSCAQACPSHPSLSLQRPCRRSEEHTSELQSQSNLVCRLLLEKKKQIDYARLLDVNISCDHLDCTA